MKLIHIFLILLLIFFLGGAFLFFWAFEIGENGIVIKDGSKPILKDIAQKINKAVYDKATEYNPKGDVLPDQIDDNVKEKIKESLGDQKSK